MSDVSSERLRDGSYGTGMFATPFVRGGGGIG